ncbi:MAG: hypothetical protein JWN34_2056 [Bryobacterales bacterium]|nr:hypothetical protein [Bryobacterales bacterium]
MKGNRGGRPSYEPTPADRATVQNLSAVGVSHAEIARCIGAYGISEPTLRKHFRRELDVSLTEVKALAMSGLVKALKRGDGWAVGFLLTCRGGWQETTAQRFVDLGGQDRPFTLADADRLLHGPDPKESPTKW